jgi:hypothetical protein
MLEWPEPSLSCNLKIPKPTDLVQDYEDVSIRHVYK